MSLELFHIHLGQSERIVWLLEELQVPYEIKIFYRDPVTALGPSELKSANPAGTAPYLRDTNVSPPVCLSESTAIATYILTVYGPQAAARLDRKPGDPDYAAYLEWFHFANGTLQASMFRQMGLLVAVGGDRTQPLYQRLGSRLESQLKMVDQYLERNKWFAGDEFTAADCMTMFSLSTMRGFCPIDLSPYPNILRWMQDCADRPAYKRALEKGDGGMEPMIGADVRRFTEFQGLKPLLEKTL